MRPMRRFGQGCARLLLSFAASGQQTVGPLIERIEVNIVNVDVSVTDRAGHPIGGLTRDDFEGYEDGRPQKNTNFYTIENTPAKSETSRDSPQVPPNIVMVIANDFIYNPARVLAMYKRSGH